MLAETTTQRPYIGRFAPTPSGKLHFGSLVTALGSWLEARTRQGQWLVRIEDLDPLRETPEAASHILHTLEAFGLHWDQAVVYQSQRSADYQAALDQLIRQQRAYPCSCSRKELAGFDAYPGFCRNAPRHPQQPLAWRFRTSETQISWMDRFQGHQTRHLQQLGDVVIRRKEQLWSYQLAVVVDDLAQGITHIVRGLDLLDSTPWQMDIQQCLAPGHSFHYGHLPLIVNGRGQKLSKQNLARPIAPQQASQLLYKALQCLCQPVDTQWQTLAPETLLQTALAHWQPATLQGVQQQVYQEND